MAPQLNRHRGEPSSDNAFEARLLVHAAPKHHVRALAAAAAAAASDYAAAAAAAVAAANACAGACDTGACAADRAAAGCVGVDGIDGLCSDRCSGTGIGIGVGSIDGLCSDRPAGIGTGTGVGKVLAACVALATRRPRQCQQCHHKRHAGRQRQHCGAAHVRHAGGAQRVGRQQVGQLGQQGRPSSCLLYTSDAADDTPCVDL
eukprot:25838-Chlamydomonas_euryale.AAC.1